MAIEQLSDEQVRTWTLAEKDRWWLENIYRGEMPQLTLRSACTGFLLGGLLSATNLYIGAKTGWSLGVGITSVILAFALFRTLWGLGIVRREFTILENNAMQSIATSAGYMTSPLTSSMAAYMLVDGRLVPWHQLVIWNVLVSILGVLFAFPMKRRFINDEQHAFPEGRAAAVVMDTLHHSDAALGMSQASAMIWSAATAGVIKFFQAEGIQELIQFKWMGLRETLKDQTVRFPEHLDALLTRLGIPLPKIGGTPIDQLTVVPSLDLAMMGAGGLMGIRGGLSLLVGAILNYCVLAPWMIQLGQIEPRVVNGNEVFGLRQIALWSLWPGVACMVAASFYSFLSKPQALLKAISGAFSSKGKESDDVLRDIELPLWISAIGIPIVSVLSAFVAHQFFGVNMIVCLVGLPLTFVLSLVAANSTALTSITPVGATSKITLLFYGVIQPGNIRTNIATASLTAEVVSNASNLLMDIKPGYMLGAKPRQQAIGHLIGIVAGSICSVPLFYLLFTQNVKVDAATGVTTGIETIQSEDFPMPSVTVWKAVAEVLTEGLHKLPETAQYAVVVAALVGVALEVSRVATKGRFPLSPVGLGLAFVIDFSSSFAMFLGALFFWIMGVEREKRENEAPSFWKKNHEAICAGLIAGAALIGILDALVTVFLL